MSLHFFRTLFRITYYKFSKNCFKKSSDIFQNSFQAKVFLKNVSSKKKWCIKKLVYQKMVFQKNFFFQKNGFSKFFFNTIPDFDLDRTILPSNRLSMQCQICFCCLQSRSKFDIENFFSSTLNWLLVRLPNWISFWLDTFAKMNLEL